MNSAQSLLVVLALGACNHPASSPSSTIPVSDSSSELNDPNSLVSSNNSELDSLFIEYGEAKARCLDHHRVEVFEPTNGRGNEKPFAVHDACILRDEFEAALNRAGLCNTPTPPRGGLSELGWGPCE